MAAVLGVAGAGAGGVGGWRRWGRPASLPMAMSSPSPIAAAANLPHPSLQALSLPLSAPPAARGWWLASLGVAGVAANGDVIAVADRCRRQPPPHPSLQALSLPLSAPQLAPRRRQPPSPIAPTPFSVAAALQTRPIAAERAVHTSAGGTHDLQSPPTWGFSVRSDETVAIPPQKWHLIATRFKTDTRKGQFDDLPGRSRAFVWPRRRLWGPTFAWPCRPLRGPTFAWPSRPLRGPTFAWPCRPLWGPTFAWPCRPLRGPTFAWPCRPLRGPTFTGALPTFAGAGLRSLPSPGLANLCGGRTSLACLAGLRLLA